MKFIYRGRGGKEGRENYTRRKKRGAGKNLQIEKNQKNMTVKSASCKLDLPTTMGIPPRT